MKHILADSMDSLMLSKDINVYFLLIYFRVFCKNRHFYFLNHHHTAEENLNIYFVVFKCQLFD
jgi:hypothetical protein